MSAPGSSRFTSEGTNTGQFGLTDWALLLTVALIWGSSFLWIAISLDDFHPGLIAFGRLALGAAVIWLVPSARIPMPRSTWPALSVVTLAGVTAPAVFFPLAQQHVESSVAGMFNSVSPILVLFVAVAMTRKLPHLLQVIGLTVGLIGAILLAVPNLSGADAEPLGVLLVVLAVSGYALSNNFLPPLVQAYGGPAVMVRATFASTVLMAPWGFWAVGESTFAWKSAVALFILGVAGTGIARSLFATLGGRVGAPRSSLVGYLIPLVAVALGVAVRDESVGLAELAGTGLILVGAWLISRGHDRRSSTNQSDAA